MRQHMLNGWLVAALFALVCLLGTTAYVEVKKDLPKATCLHGERAPPGLALGCESCNPVSCDMNAPKT